MSYKYLLEHMFVFSIWLFSFYIWKIMEIE
nr:MAG TPA: hypothetical protein [Caudoviricetes sp.]